MWNTETFWLRIRIRRQLNRVRQILILETIGIVTKNKNKAFFYVGHGYRFWKIYPVTKVLKNPNNKNLMLRRERARIFILSAQISILEICGPVTKKNIKNIVPNMNFIYIYLYFLARKRHLTRTNIVLYSA